MLTAKCLALRKVFRLNALRSRQNDTKGGSSDTEAKELTVMPTNRPSGSQVVMTAMPVANQPSALRKSRELKLSIHHLNGPTGCPLGRPVGRAGDRPGSAKR